MSESGFDTENDQEVLAETYLLDLGLSWEDLAGKRVLDVGAGLRGYVEAGKRRGIDVVSLDKFPQWYFDKGRPSQNAPYVIGDAYCLSFAKTSFDMIVSRAASHSIIDTFKDFKSLIQDEKRYCRKVENFDSVRKPV